MKALDFYATLLAQIKEKIQTAQYRTVWAVNEQLLQMYWEIGHLIEQLQKTEGWSAGIIPRLAKDLKNEFPEIKGFSERNLSYMLRFVKEYPDRGSFYIDLLFLSPQNVLFCLITTKLLAIKIK